MKKTITLTESDLQNLIIEALNEYEGFRAGFNDAYLDNHLFKKYDQSVHGNGYTEKEGNDGKWRTFKNRVGGALGAMASGQIPTNTFKDMNLDKKRAKVGLPPIDEANNDNFDQLDEAITRAIRKYLR